VRLVLVPSLLAALAAAHAQPLSPGEVPPTLRPWIPWAMHGSEQRTCPRLQGNEAAAPCVYVGRLQLEATPRGGRFRQEVEVFVRDAVPLPGDAEHWPLDVRDGATSVAVVDHAGGPATFLGPGTHVLTGAFGWDAVPAVRNGCIVEIKSPLILQPGPAALTDGLDAIIDAIDRCALRPDNATAILPPLASIAWRPLMIRFVSAECNESGSAITCGTEPRVVTVA